MSAGADKSAKDKAMAAYMKAKGITRHTGTCGICHHPVTVGGAALLSHVNTGCRPRLWAKRDAITRRIRVPA